MLRHSFGIYYNIHCYFSQYNSLDYYADSDMGTIAFGLYYNIWYF